jgi:AraC-like DNA-binding protein
MDVHEVRTTQYELAEAGAIEDFLVQAYGSSMRIRGGDGHSLLRHQRTDAGAVAVESAYQSADLSFAVEPLHKIVVTRTVTSRLERASGSEDRSYETGELFIMSQPDRPYTARWLPGEIQNCIIDPDLLTQVAATTPARKPAPIRFTSLNPHTPDEAARWWATRTFVASLLADPQATGSPLVLASAAQLLAAVTLAVFPNSAVTDPTIEDRHDAHPDTLRRAVAFIDENAHTGITIADIAAAAFVTIRAVQLAFRTHLDTTPMAYLRRVRLDRAHQDLLAADPEHETVTAVAYRWGFPSTSRFATHYRQAYGILPSRTLHKD